MQLRSLLALALLPASLAAVLRPKLPHRFTAKLEVTTKHLKKDNVYPPAWRHIDVRYDWRSKRAWCLIHTSYEKRQKQNGTTYLRRYDLGREWELAQFGDRMNCKWSRILNAKMPRPEFLGKGAVLAEAQVACPLKVKGKKRKCRHWTDGDKADVHYYETASGARRPVLLENADMTYGFLEFEDLDDADQRRRRGVKLKDAARAFDEQADFVLEGEYGEDEKGLCARVPQDVGFPYVHLLHTYIRF